MKKHWYSALGIIALPLIMLMVGFILTGIGRIQFTNTTLSAIVNCGVYFGQILIKLFPLALVVSYTGRQYEDSIVVIVSIACYLLLNVVTMFLNDGQYASYFYDNVLGLSYNMATATTSVTKMPLNIGIFGSVIVGLIILFVYKNSRKRYNYGALSFISNDAWFFLGSVILTIVAAIAINYISPIVFNFVRRTIRFIARNNTNPASLFLFGILDKLCSTFGVHNIIEDGFWLGELGGSWMDASKTTILGDINIWTAQMAAGTLTTGVGKYVTAYYVNNIFVIPSILFAIYIHTTDKMERHRSLGLILVALLVSLVCGSAVPVEIVLLIIAPTLFSIHVIISGFINMALSMCNVSLGCVLTGTVTTSNVGNLIDYIHYSNELLTKDAAFTILIIGIVCFVGYQIIVDVYYRYLSRFFLESDKAREETIEIIRDLGGFNNIKMMTATPNKVIVVLKDKARLDADALIETTVYKITERYFGFVLEYGPGSYALVRHIKKELKNYDDCMKYHKGV